MQKDQPETLLDVLQDEKASKYSGGIYHKIQIELTYNSNHIEGSRLTHDQTRYIFETNTIGAEKNEVINVDDVIETANHFRCIDMIIECANVTLSEEFIKELHFILKTGISDSRKEWFAGEATLPLRWLCQLPLCGLARRNHLALQTVSI